MRRYFVIGLSLSILLLALFANYSPDHGFSRLISIPQQPNFPLHPDVSKTDPYLAQGTTGYDSQFYILLALDPTLNDPKLISHMDAPAYRARRIGLPVVAWLLGLGSADWIIQIFSLINVAVWIGLGFYLKHQLQHLRTTEALVRWSACMFSVAVMDSARLSLTDLPSALFILMGITAYERGVLGRGTACLAAATFIKETSVLALLASIPRSWQWRAWLKCFLWSLLVVVPYSLWLLYIQTKLPPYVGVGGNFGLPFHAMGEYMLRAAQKIISGEGNVHNVFGFLGVLSGLVQIGILARYFRWNHHWWLVALPYALIFIFSGEKVWSSNMAGLRIVLPMTLIVLMQMPRHRWFYLSTGIISLPSIYGLIRWIYNS